MLPGITLATGDLSPELAGNLLEAHGIVCLEEIDEGKLASIVAGLGKTLPHPDADEEGVTKLGFDSGKAAGLNRLGFSRRALRLHTDRSILSRPPDLLIFWCDRQARSGGQTTLADGKMIYRTLRRRYPFLIEHLENADNFVFRTDCEMRSGAVFERDGDSRRSVRLRLDDLLYVSQPLWEWMGVIADCVEEARLTYKLQPGQGYILQNTRWLHGRQPFFGPRTCKRILVSANEENSALRSFRI
jgi:alpha-ketoglutarate-dependent taurine dioxygenase